MNIVHLQSGGLITNYNCSSKCRHCLYASSPTREKQYIDADCTARVFSKISELHCRAIHVGGGEPFLNIEGLKEVLDTARQSGIHIDYVETNSSWFKDHDQACTVLWELKKHGLSTLLISISPFHNEFIPFRKVKGVIEACNDTGISVFPWIADFYGDIDSFPDDFPHPLERYMDIHGPQYIKKIFRKYWIHPGGRALTGFLHLYGQKKTQHIIDTAVGGCNELVNTSHFHFDPFGNYIPGLCAGIQIHYSHMGTPLKETDYPYLLLLYREGIAAFYRKAVAEHGFTSQEEYTSKCHLCFDIRRFLLLEKGLEIKEFGPIGFYKELT